MKSRRSSDRATETGRVQDMDRTYTFFPEQIKFAQDYKRGLSINASKSDKSINFRL